MILKKELPVGIHIIALPITAVTDISSIFPAQISGSTIEILLKSGYWSKKQTILYEHNHLMVSHRQLSLEPFSTIRLNLKRAIIIDWNIEFSSNSSIKKADMNYYIGFDVIEALNMAQLSNLVYEDEKDIFSALENNYKFDNFFYGSEQDYCKNSKIKKLWNPLIKIFNKYINRIDLQFMMAQTIDENTGKKLLIIVFRGSQEAYDWVTDLTFKQDRFSNKGHVHKGFKKSLHTFLKRIKNYEIARNFKASQLSKNVATLNNEYKILIGGHSLGGAIATLTGCYLSNLGINKENMEIYTFGAPPVGSNDFCAYYKNKINLYRIVNENDIVPKLDKVLKFSHFGKEIILESNEGEIHSCTDYIDNIIDLISNSNYKNNHN